jgi:hypothetical protein
MWELLSSKYSVCEWTFQNILTDASLKQVQVDYKIYSQAKVIVLHNDLNTFQVQLKEIKGDGLWNLAS